MRPHHEERAFALSLCLDLYTESMASFDSFPSEADRMAQGACDGSETTVQDPTTSHQETSLVRAQTAPNSVHVRYNARYDTIYDRLSPDSSMLMSHDTESVSAVSPACAATAARG